VSGGEQLQLFPLPTWPSTLDEFHDYEELLFLQARWPCPACGEMPLPWPWPDKLGERLRPYYGYDPCLGCLSGVLYACCGHGKPTGHPHLVMDGGGGSMYVADHPQLHDEEALEYFRSLGVGPPPECDEDQPMA
jgi:hypothetical protein